MDKIFSLKQADALAQELQEKEKRIVLLGGCFDLLHIGHITFLEEAKKQADTLVVLLEADETISREKGPHRPVNSQEDRARILSALTTVDYIILLKPTMTDKEYDKLVFTIKPAIIATTRGDMNRYHKERQAKQIRAQVIDVTPHISDKSTTKLINLLNEL